MYENILSSMMKPMGRQKSNSLEDKSILQCEILMAFEKEGYTSWKYLDTLAALYCSTYLKQQQCLPIMYFLCLGFRELQDRCLPVKKKNS